MRYFLYTYVSRQNWETTVKAGVFGSKKDDTGLPTKVKALRRGDLIVIRDGSRQEVFTILGCCTVCGDVFDQDLTDCSRYPKLLWSDEKNKNQLIYPLRVAVETKGFPNLALEAVTWNALDDLGFLNAKGKPLCSRRAWGKKFVGNYLETESEVKSFSKLIGYPAA